MSGREIEFPSYNVIYRQGNGVYEEKKSRFIAQIAPADSEEAALAFIESVRKKYYDARHNCTAFVIGGNSQVTRCSDDGEPSGTAGKPILEVLLGAKVTNAAAVVTRYFGGTLLGTGGLVRAYTQAAQAALQDAGIGFMQYGAEITVEVDYPDVSKVQYFFPSRKIEVIDARYTEKAAFDICIPAEQRELVQEELIQLTAARARITVTKEGYYMSKASVQS